ncbi:MAG: patatin-like phospholipase family protein [Bradymonadaceae bacterium]|nr:patatin-like phospholipase family protein [Lujinxingiaceae bacterium]
MSKTSNIALVLSGGGARGAYEAGALRYILDVVPKSLGRPVRFSIISGTSVGAINAAWVAATLNDPQRSVQRLWYLWRTLRFSEVVGISYTDLWRMFRSLVGEDTILRPRHTATGSREGGFLKTNFFDSLLRREIPFHNVQRNIERGLLDAVSVSATDIVSGKTTVFIQSREQTLPPWTRDFRRVAVAGPITADKVLASAAIPLLFPAVKIGQHWFCDGGIRQNTPMSPALRLGADKLLVLSLQNRPAMPPMTPFAGAPGHNVAHPKLSFVLGKLLDAVLLDPLDYDLSVLARINALIEHGEEAFGDESFLDKINEVVRAHRGQDYRFVDYLLLRSSYDLGKIAADVAMSAPDSFWGSPIMRRICQGAADTGEHRESDLMSYLLFDGRYTGQLLDLGYNDARARHDELVEFLS